MKRVIKYEDAVQQLNHIKNFIGYEKTPMVITMIDSIDIAIDALKKQTPMRGYYEYDDEFTCPACNYEEDGANVIHTKFCPECGQKLCWD